MALGGAAFLGFVLFNTLITMSSDYLWFQGLGLSKIFWTSLLSKLSLGIGASLLFWILVYINMWWARHRASKNNESWTDDGGSSSNPLAVLATSLQPLVTLGSIFVAYLVGVWASNQWEMVLRFFHAVPFGIKDPLFQKDIAYHVFSMPFYRFVFAFLVLSVIFSAIGALVSYFLKGRFRFSERGLWMAEEAKHHLVVLLGILVLLMTMHYHLRIFELVVSQRDLAPGAGYADEHVTIGFLKLLRVLAPITAVLIWMSLRFIRRRLVLIALGILIGASFLSTGAKGLVQKFRVDPNELAIEFPYIQWAIDSTRKAYELESIEERTFDATTDLTRRDLEVNAATIQNIRLWDHSPLLTTYGQLQEIRTYYQFFDVDNDRYTIDGDYRQVMLSPRELFPENLPSRNWINEHLTYTHGYGLCLGPVNRISPEGLPEFFIKDIPPKSTVGLSIKVPQIYYGESNSGYAIVRTLSKEFDYPSGDKNVYTRYEGEGGVAIGGFLRKLLFAFYFKEAKIFFSKDIIKESKILYHRRVMDRVNKAVPFITFDPDPYIVVTDDGRLVWILDGYTSTNRYPYSVETLGLGNYIRNSVKLTLDAYDGKITFYVSHPSDPIIQTYRKIFPGIFKDLDDMPADIRAHIRYPQTYFLIQAHIFATYHMTDPQIFYNKEDLWAIPVRSTQGRTTPMAPYYTIMKVADAETTTKEEKAGSRSEEFILMIPFTPANKKNMIAWMAARCDDPHYGSVLVYNFPKQKLIFGPQQIDNRIDQNAEIAEQLTLWDQTGSQVIRGSLLVIPVEDSLLYIQPLYLEAEGGGLPELRRVIVAYGSTIVMEPTLELALPQIFKGSARKRARTKSGSQPEAISIKSLISQASAAFRDGQDFLKKGDWTGYGESMEELEELIKEMTSHR